MRILVATSGSSHCDLAIGAGATMALAAHSSVTLLTVVKQPGQNGQARAVLTRASSLMAGLPAPSTKVRHGYPAEEIVHEAQEGGYDLVVLGTWPKHNLLNRLLAPTTERVLSQLKCPVLVVKSELVQVRRLLLCASGADSPSRPANFVAKLAANADGNLEITLLHVMSQVSAGPGIRDDWQLHAGADRLMQQLTPEGRLLRKDVERFSRTTARLLPKVRHGLIVEQILTEAKEGHYDLTVIGANREVGWRRYLLDDLTHQIVVGISKPILVV